MLARVRLYGEAQLRCEPAGAQDAEGVFLEALLGIAHHADDALLYIIDATQRVEDARIWLVSEGIHGEVAAAEVLLYGGDE